MIASLPSHMQRILVVDDEENIRHLLLVTLKKAGFEPTAAPGAVEALRLLQEQEFGVVISDVRMPDRNGYEVFRTAREHAPGAAIILMTGFGYDPNHSIVRSNQEGLEAFLFKPFRVAQLIEEVHKALEGSGSRSAGD